MVKQIKLQDETKSNLDSIEWKERIFFKSYDQKVSFIYQFYDTHRHLLKQSDKIEFLNQFYETHDNLLKQNDSN